MKDTFYFSHDYNARTDPKIKRLMARQPGEIRRLRNPLLCYAVTARFLKYSEMKLKEFKPNSKEVEYWRRVHQLNATEERRIKERQSQLLPARNYIIHTLENLTPGGE
ncbi:MAG: hypothetical protein BWZ00_01901 [Bacteroidetes bacterium ADurb.BinA174]|nr:MAG: hypothetical protein BWZ00_01901 [Bacteroidetes bacterium ADurb.BinA174]